MPGFNDESLAGQHLYCSYLCVWSINLGMNVRVMPCDDELLEK